MKTKSIIITTLTLLFAAGITSCSKSDGEETTQNTKEKEDTPQFVDDKGEALTPAQEQAFGKSINDFTFNMFRTMAAQHPRQSLVSSPLSAATLLAMLNDGAWGQTREQLLQVLGFEGAKSRSVNEYFQKLMKETVTSGGTTKLTMANAMYVRQGYEFLSAYATDMSNYYGATAETLDFDDAKSVDYINSWCNKQSNGMIPQMVTQIPPATLSLLLNAIYFSGKWKTPFEKEQTGYGAFTQEDAKTSETEMMHLGTKDVLFRETQDYKALQMDYEAGDFAMTLLLPSDGKTTADIIGSVMGNDTWSALCASLTTPEPYIVITLPRFTIETGDEAMEDLTGTLKKMGAVAMFSPSADFPNILKEDNLAVSQLRQKAKLMVTEDGTEAAAITISGLDGSPMPGTPTYPTFKADHPFVYVISNSKTGVVYFIGQYHGE